MNKLLSFLILSVVFAAGCKKDNIPSKTPISQSKISELKNWFDAHKSSRHGLQSKDSTDGFFDEQTPIWDSTIYYPNENIFTTPLQIEESTDTNTTQSLVLHTDSQGNVISGEYTFIRLTETPGNLTKEELIEAYPRVFDFINMPTNFEASMIKYNLEGEVIYSKHLDQQVVSETDEKVISYERVANEPGIEFCVDHWWIIYENGHVQSITYLGSDCYCYNCNPNVGGGGSGSSGNPTICQMNHEQALNCLSSMSGTNTYEYSYTSISNLPTSNPSDPERQAVTCKWGFRKLTIIPGYTSNFIAFYPGIRFRNNSTDPWKWESLNYDTFDRTGDKPPCTDISTTVSSTPCIINSWGNATATLSYHIVVSLSCAYGTEIGEKSADLNGILSPAHLSD